MDLILVESPTKARTFNRILKGKDYFVYATLGHIRDLPTSKMAIDFTNFKPQLIFIKKKSKIVTELKKLIKNHDRIILATDPDREGESISYHAAFLGGYIKENWPEFSIANPKKQMIRIVFHEITEKALQDALDNPVELRGNLVKAQLARRILDRIVGYELSPLLWKKTGKNWLSAGRVQTVALRLVVEREKEIAAFTKEPYFQISAVFEKKPIFFPAELISKDTIPYGQSYTIQLFAGDYRYTKTSITSENKDAVFSDIQKDTFTVSEIKEDIRKRNPPSPFTTSLLQQEGFNKHGYSAKMVMKLAQDLYEHGVITYHRTDSVNLSSQFTSVVQTFIKKTFGKEYVLPEIRIFKTKSKLAQEAHEAIRPTNITKTPQELNEETFTNNHRKLYKLIWDRTVSCQMKEAEIRHIKILITSTKGYLFSSDYQQVLFDGFLRVANPEYATKNAIAPKITVGSSVLLKSIDAKESISQPPPRYNEASIIKILEEKGIGRPSTYAPIISLIVDKGYVEKENKSFLPTIIGTAISDYLSKSFPELFDLNFTALMEESLDKIAGGDMEIVKLLSDFFAPFQKQLNVQKEEKKSLHIQEETNEICPTCSKPLIMRYSKFGKFLGCSGFPDCKFTKPFLKIVQGFFCPKCGGNIIVRQTKSHKRFYGCSNYPKCDYSSWKIEVNKKIEKTNETS